MMTRPARKAQIEIVEADVDWTVEVDAQGRAWTDQPAPSMRPHFLRIVAANGRTLMTSGNFAHRASATRAADSLAIACAEIAARGPQSAVRFVSAEGEATRSAQAGYMRSWRSRRRPIQSEAEVPS